MNRLRINNTSVSVAVLSACLALLAAGASTHAPRTASSVLSEIAAAASANITLSHSPRSQLKLTAPYNSQALPAAQREGGAGEVLYRNTNRLTTPQQILVVTTLARAALEDSRA